MTIIHRILKSRFKVPEYANKLLMQIINRSAKALEIKGDLSDYCVNSTTKLDSPELLVEGRTTHRRDLRDFLNERQSQATKKSALSMLKSDSDMGQIQGGNRWIGADSVLIATVDTSISQEATLIKESPYEY